MPKSSATTVAFRPSSSLTPWSRNYNRGDVDAISRSIARFGFNGTLRVWRDGVVVAGNHGLAALLQLKAEGAPPPVHIELAEDGDWLVPVTDVSHLSETLAEAFAVADNRTRDLATTDDAQLAAILQGIVEADASLLDATGYDYSDLGALLAGLEDGLGPHLDPEPKLDQAEELALKWGTEPGQIWLLDDHRLAIGDCTDAGLVSRLLDGDQAACMWTDPPYGVNYVGGTEDALTIQNDDPEGLESLLTRAFATADQVLAPGAAIYVAHPSGPLGTTFALTFNATGWQLRQTLIWVKDRLVLGRSDYHYRHEPVLYGFKPSAKGRRGRGGAGWYGGNRQTSVFEVARAHRNTLHPTIKPVELVARMVHNSTRAGDVVYEPFCGSGSTLLACEQLDRRCRALEIDPKFAAVILERYVDATGALPVLEGAQEEA
jgi:DNA modification methylase